MLEDIGSILRSWPYDPQNSIRKVIDQDGSEKIQVRVDQGAFQGVLQMELDGRPDGVRPHNQPFALDHYKEMLRKQSEDPGGGVFQLDRKACEEIFDESRRVYERYVFLLQIQDYTRVIRDTERNIEVFRFVNQYAEREEDRTNLERWWPYILRIHGVARAMAAVQNEDYETAFTVIRETRERIEGLEEVDAEEFTAERKRSRQALDELEAEIREKRPLSQSEQLKEALAEAIEEEEFERAAELRDKLRELDSQ
ncbi:MAG: UvrB/UvrC motif-containing protein [Candidatus Latescibacteria bacterium]|jgi:hypothetical protein|nr:UvrB/UvrC motif-containing protein [Candidatus Latescibacterota bacterium]